MSSASETRTEFSLRKLATVVWDDLGACDYHVIAKEIARRIGHADREAALSQALDEYARHFVVGLRPSARRFRPGAGQQNSARSSKVAGIRHAWPQLRATYLTKDGQKPLGDCTGVDLVFIVANLETKARENTAKATWMKELGAAVAAANVKRVRDLPDDVLATFLEGRAA